MSLKIKKINRKFLVKEARSEIVSARLRKARRYNYSKQTGGQQSGLFI